jgi:diguanylate cyclase (GGDEF)-like protein/PAS domain S-box-containing protein
MTGQSQNTHDTIPASISALIAGAIHQTHVAVIVMDVRGRFVYANNAFSALTGLDQRTLLKRSIYDLCRDQLASRGAIESALKTLRRKSSCDGEVLLYNRDHHPIWGGFSVTKVRDDAGKLWLVATVTDITYGKLYESLQQKVLEALIQDKALSDILTLICLEAEELLPGITMSIQRIDQDGRIRPLAGPHLPDSYKQALNGAAIGPSVGSCGTSAYRGEPVLVNDIATDPLWEGYTQLVAPLGFNACWSTPVKDRCGRVAGTFAFYSHTAITLTPFIQSMVDICTRLCALAFEKRDYEDRLQFLAHHDALTALPNRTFFQRRLSEEAIRARRRKSALALHVIDLDRFKEVNDTLGHPVGDDVLKIVARTLIEHSSKTDVIARLGGDEFMLLQTGVKSAADARLRAEHLIHAVRNAIMDHVPLTAGMVSASLGYALYPQDAANIDLLIRHADMALYRAKSEGRNRACAFDASMADAVNHRRRLEHDLREALSRDDQAGPLGLSLAYQPQLRLSDQSLIGFEALARWHHPEFGAIAPDIFIPIAEEAGLIVPLGEWILKEACTTAATWDMPLTIAVNLSPLQIFDGDLAHHVHDVLVRTGLAPSRLELEVTEGVLIQNTDRALHILRRLKMLGVSIAMDDFGTGYSSLSYLQIFPFDKIKIDRAFISDLERNGHAKAIVRAVIGLGHAIGVPVLAEGVETESQLEILRSNGCDEAQGFLIGRPMPQASIASYLSLWAHPASTSLSQTPQKMFRA